MAERTENYGLALWGAADEMERGTVNGNWEAVDEALGALTVVAGTYQGQINTNTGKGKDTVITLGFRPRAVFAITTSNASPYANLALDGADTGCLQIKDSGFVTKGALNYMDNSSTTRNPYRYLAWK